MAALLYPLTLQVFQIMFTNFVCSSFYNIYQTRKRNKWCGFACRSCGHFCLPRNKENKTPLTWQGCLLPVMAESMLDMVCAPVPYFMGVLKHMMPTIEAFAAQGMISDALVLDLDKDRFLLTPTGHTWDWTGLPHRARTRLMSSVAEFRKTYQPLLKRKQEAKMAFPSEHFHIPFIQFFVSLLGHYKQAMQPQGIAYRFDPKRFVELAPAEHRVWLAAFVDCSMMLDMFAQDREVHLLSYKGPFDDAVDKCMQITRGAVIASNVATHMYTDTRMHTAPTILDRNASFVVIGGETIDKGAEPTSIVPEVPLQIHACLQCQASFPALGMTTPKFCTQCGAPQPTPSRPNVPKKRSLAMAAIPAQIQEKFSCALGEYDGTATPAGNHVFVVASDQGSHSQHSFSIQDRIHAWAKKTDGSDAKIGCLAANNCNVGPLLPPPRPPLRRPPATTTTSPIITTTSAVLSNFSSPLRRLPLSLPSHPP
jgi:hypothetical protein